MLTMRGDARGLSSRRGGVFAFFQRLTNEADLRARLREVEGQRDRALQDRAMADQTITDLMHAVARADQDSAALGRELSYMTAKLTSRAERAESLVRELAAGSLGLAFKPEDRIADYAGVTL